MGLLDQCYSTSAHNFTEEPVLFSTTASPVGIPTSSARELLFLHILVSTENFFDDSSSKSVRHWFPCGFDLQFWINSYVDYLSVYLLAFEDFPWKMSKGGICTFLMVFFFAVELCEFFVYLAVKLSSDVCFANIFSPLSLSFFFISWSFLFLFPL